MTATTSAEHLYYKYWPEWSSSEEIVALPILKKTAKRIYFAKRSVWLPRGGRYHVSTGFVDRQAIEAAGDNGLYCRPIGERLYLDPPEKWRPPAKADHVAELDLLKAEMADAHPDKGGSHEAFIAAHARYVQARDRVTS